MTTVRSHVAGGPTSPVDGVRRHVTEIVGTSDTSVDAAIDDGVARATGPAEAVEWFEVTGIRSNVLGSVYRYRVALRLGLRPAA